MTATTPGNPDAIAPATGSSTLVERRRFEAVVNFTDTAGVGDCMLALNKRGLVYTNGVLYTEFEPIADWETVVSGTVSGTIEIAAGEDESEIFALVHGLVEPFGGECPEFGFVDDQQSASPVL